MKFAYADPPYPKQAKRHYKNDPSGIKAEEVDHEALIRRLFEEYPDGWALSTNEPNLAHLLSYANYINPGYEPRVRTMAWVKPFAIYKVGVNPAYAWEPVLVYGGRKRGRNVPTVRDWVSANVTLKTGTHGRKPDAFVYWLFEVLNVRPGDELDDLFPGSGVVGKLFKEIFGDESTGETDKAS